MITAKDILIEAKDRYAASPSHAKPGHTPGRGEDCPITAIHRTAFSHPGGVLIVWEAEQTFRKQLGGAYIVDYNAAHDTADVLDRFDEAIAAAA